MKKLIAEIQNNGDILIALNDIFNVNFGALDRGNITDTTNWGVFSNKGEFAFIDRTNTFKSVIASYPSAEVCIYYVSNVTKKLLATFLIDDYDYNNESKKVTLTLKDKLIDWQKQNLEEYYKFVTKSIGEIWLDNHGDNSRVSDTALVQMSSCKVNTSYMQKSSKWSNADKICQATMVRCFCDTDGTPLFADETPKQFNNIVIKPRNILSIGNRVGNRKTKTENVSLSAQIITKHEDEAIASEVPFTFFDIMGTNTTYVQGSLIKNEIVADWANYSTNVTTSKYIDLDIPSQGGVVYTKVEKNNHFFNYNEYADITVNVATTSINQEKIQKTTKTTNPKKAQSQGYENYSPYKAKATEYENYIRVEYQEQNIASPYDVDNEKRDIVGTYCITDGSITVLGTFFTEDGEAVFGSTSENATNLQGNELIQTESTYEQKALAQHIVDTVMEKYGNGVECVEMEVTPSEYYDDEGINVINSNGDKPLFEKYDIVTPYVIKNGIEQPYSTKADGTAKSFKVIGIEYLYQGLLRQKLYLQETTN